MMQVDDDAMGAGSAGFVGYAGFVRMNRCGVRRGGVGWGTTRRATSCHQPGFAVCWRHRRGVNGSATGVVLEMKRWQVVGHQMATLMVLGTAFLVVECREAHMRMYSSYGRALYYHDLAAVRAVVASRLEDCHTPHGSWACGQQPD